MIVNCISYAGTYNTRFKSFFNRVYLYEGVLVEIE